MRKRAFVTGATGFVGANLVRRLLIENFEVHIVVRNTKHFWRLEDVKEKLIVYINDLSEIEPLEKLLKQISPEHIFHLAAYGAYSSQNDLEKAVLTNIVALKNLLIASKNIPYKSFINTGSSSEYGWKKKPMREIDFLDPISFYATTKAAGTLISKIFAKEFSKPICTFRLFSVYGPYEESTRFIPTAMKSAIKNTPLLLTSGIVKRDFVFVEDVVNAYLLVSKSKFEFGNVFNIGTGKQYSNQRIASIVKKYNKNKLKIEKGKFSQRSWDTSYWVANMSKTKKILGWQPKYSLDKGLKKTYDWFCKNIYLY